MTYLLQDFSGLILATFLAPLILYLPGLGLLRLLSREGSTLDPASYWPRIGWALLLGLSVMPTLDALIIRFSGIPAMLLCNAALAVWGTPMLSGMDRQQPIGRIILTAAAWWMVCAWSYVDFDSNGMLHQSFTIIDMVKHAAVTEQIAREGVPFTDPFFARDGTAGYYHYFYVWPAAVRWIGGSLIDARMAFAACTFWTGFSVVALIWRIMADARFIRPGRHQRILLLIVAFCFVAGADLLFMLFRFLTTHRIEPQLDTWNSEVRTIGASLIWVPHHVSAIVAVWTGMLLLVRAQTSLISRIRDHPRLIAAAGLAFATTFGASIWIAIGIAPFLACWAGLRLWRRDASVVVAGIGALILSLPQIHAIMNSRADAGIPIAIGVRSFTPFLQDDGIGQQLLRVALLPLNYGLELGIWALGTYLYWRHRHVRRGGDSSVRHLLLWSTLSTLFIASFFRSTIIYNDLGWRVVLFAVMATMIWTVRYAQSVAKFSRLRFLAALLLILGSAGTVWDIVGLRLIRNPAWFLQPIQFNDAPAISYALRRSYEWLGRNVLEKAVVQYNPVITQRSVDFGLYGHNWPAIADYQANLFGASKAQVDERLALVAPIFTRVLSSDQIRTRAQQARIDYLLFTARDPVWRDRHGPPPEMPCIYRSPLVCITAVDPKGRS